MSLIRKHVAVLQAWACLALVSNYEHQKFKICTNIRQNSERRSQMLGLDLGFCVVTIVCTV